MWEMRGKTAKKDKKDQKEKRIIRLLMIAPFCFLFYTFIKSHVIPDGRQQLSTSFPERNLLYEEKTDTGF